MKIRPEWKYRIVVACAGVLLAAWLWSEHVRISAEDDLLRMPLCGQKLTWAPPHYRENRLVEIRDNLGRAPDFYQKLCEQQLEANRAQLAATARALAGHDLVATGRVKTERQWLEAIERCRAAGWEAVDDMADTQSPQDRRESSLILVSTRCTPPE